MMAALIRLTSSSPEPVFLALNSNIVLRVILMERCRPLLGRAEGKYQNSAKTLPYISPATFQVFGKTFRRNFPYASIRAGLTRTSLEKSGLLESEAHSEPEQI